MSQIIIDGIAGMTLHNGIVRVECTTVQADGKPHPSGTLIIPGAIAGQVIQGLVNGLQQLDKKIREQQAAPAHAAN